MWQIYVLFFTLHLCGPICRHCPITYHLLSFITFSKSSRFKVLVLLLAIFFAQTGAKSQPMAFITIDDLNKKFKDGKAALLVSSFSLSVYPTIYSYSLFHFEQDNHAVPIQEFLRQGWLYACSQNASKC